MDAGWSKMHAPTRTLALKFQEALDLSSAGLAFRLTDPFAASSFSSLFMLLLESTKMLRAMGSRSVSKNEIFCLRPSSNRAKSSAVSPEISWSCLSVTRTLTERSATFTRMVGACFRSENVRSTRKGVTQKPRLNSETRGARISRMRKRDRACPLVQRTALSGTRRPLAASGARLAGSFGDSLGPRAIRGFAERACEAKQYPGQHESASVHR